MAKKFGDRKDGAKLRNIHAMHLVMPLMYPNRCDNEAFISERIDLTNVLAYLDEKNASNPDYKYNFFQVMVTIMLKVITLRPKMNRFIANKTMYQRNEVSAAFTVKKEFSDDGGEALCFCVFLYNAQPGVTLDYATGESAPTPLLPAPDADDSSGIPAGSGEGTHYVLNTNTHRFHYPDCSSAGRISAENRADFTGDRSELIAAGYSPCGKCDP